jgi:hypothetical protein
MNLLKHYTRRFNHALATTFGLALSLGLLAATPAALAHDDATLDAMATPHGGQLRMAGAQHLELLLVSNSPAAKDNPVLLYLSDHAGTPLAAQGAKATVTLLSGKDKLSVTLAPAGGNLLKGTARYASNPGIKAVVSLNMPGEDAVQARFTPLAPRPGAAK